MTGRGLAALLGRRVAGDEETVVQMLVARAETRLTAQRREIDALDLKALGLLCGLGFGIKVKLPPER
jgi:hypothetical protein